MGIKVKSSQDSAVKWVDNAGRAATAAVNGAVAAANDWLTNTTGASDNFRNAITAPGMDTRFKAGVSKAGAEKFARKVKELTAARYPSGVQAGKADYQTNVEPFLQTISGLSLSARRPRGDAGNYTRTQEVGKALNAKRLALLGMGA